MGTKAFREDVQPFQVKAAVALSCAIWPCMEKDDPIVRVGFNVGVKRPYYGMVHNREPHQRWQEHLRATIQHGSGMATEKEQNILIYVSKWGCFQVALLTLHILWQGDCSAEAERSRECSHRAAP